MMKRYSMSAFTYKESYEDKDGDYYKVVDVDEKIKDLKEIISQVHSWIVCSAISSPEDMIKSADWIEDITNLDVNMLYNKESIQ